GAVGQRASGYRVLECDGRIAGEVHPDAGALRAAERDGPVCLAGRGAHAVAADDLVVRAAVVGAHARPVVLQSADDEVGGEGVAGHRVVQMRGQTVVLGAAEGRAVV